jgi:hypothetical protein
LACSISERAAKWAIGDWMKRKHQWTKLVKGFLQEPSAKRIKELLELKTEPAETSDMTITTDRTPSFKGIPNRTGTGK